MFEFLLALFVFFTVFIDTLSILLKGSGSDQDLAKVYMVSQALTYITRFSLFFILPVIGLILDEVIAFKVSYFILYLGLFILIHGIIYILKFRVVISNSDRFVSLFNKSIFEFTKFGFFHLFFCSKSNQSFKVAVLKLKDINILYGVSHFFLALIFPTVLIVGELLPDYRGVLMGSMSVYTGVFSIYITFFIERKVPYLNEAKRTKYIASLVATKIITSVVVFLSVLFYLFISRNDFIFVKIGVSS